MNNTSEVSIIMSFVAGVLIFLSPCILPLFPSYITYITGKTFEDITTGAASSDIRKTTAKHSLFFILGFTIVFVLLGATIGYLGSFFGIKKIYLERVGGILVILFGLHMVGLLNIGLLNKEKKIVYHRKKASFLGSLLVGMAFAFGWTPCIGSVLSSILIYASTLESMGRAVLLLSVFSLGLGLPFFVASIAINQFLSVFNRFKAVMKYVPIVTGVFLIVIGILLFSGKFSVLAGLFAG